MNEVWRIIPSLPGYLASTEGRIRGVTGRVLTPVPNSTGYLRFYAQGKRRFVHRAVLEAFKGPSELDARHLDGDRTNNRAANLDYGTWHENEADKKLHGTWKHPRAKLTIEAVVAIRASSETLKVLSERYGVTMAAISYARKGQTWN